MKSLARPCSSWRLLGRWSPCLLSSQNALLGSPPTHCIQTQRPSEDSPGTIPAAPLLPFVSRWQDPCDHIRSTKNPGQFATCRCLTEACLPSLCHCRTLSVGPGGGACCEHLWGALFCLPQSSTVKINDIGTWSRSKVRAFPAQQQILLLLMRILQQILMPAASRGLGKLYIFSSKQPSSKPPHTLRNLGGVTPLTSKYFFSHPDLASGLCLKLSLKTIGSNHSL